MVTTQDDLQALKEARRQSAAKVRALLEQLEEAEKEFNSINVQLRSIVEPKSATTLANQGGHVR